MKIPPISQSLIKHVNAFSNGDFCGLLLKHIWIDGGKMPASDAMKLGQYFEYKATGALTYHGEIPEPERNKTPDKATRARISEVRKWITRRAKLKLEGIGSPETVRKWRKWVKEYEGKHGSLTAAYEIADKQAANFRRYLTEWKWTLKKVAPKETRDGMHWSLDAIIEVAPGGYWPWDHCGIKSEFHSSRYDGREFILDLKFTGLLWNKHDPQGFGGNLGEKVHAIQARHYYLYGLPVAFGVFGTNRAMECRIIPTVPDNIDGHMQAIEDTRNKITAAILTGAWKPHPHYKRCRECPLVKTCEHKRLAPAADQLEIV